MRKIKKLSHWIKLVDQITEEDIKKEPLEPCPICGDNGLTPNKRYWVISDPVLLCEEHGKKLDGIAMDSLKKLDSFKSKEEFTAWRNDPKAHAEKQVMQTVIQFFNGSKSNHHKVNRYATKVAHKLWPWLMDPTEVNVVAE